MGSGKPQVRLSVVLLVLAVLSGVVSGVYFLRRLAEPENRYGADNVVLSHRVQYTVAADGSATVVEYIHRDFASGFRGTSRVWDDPAMTEIPLLDLEATLDGEPARVDRFREEAQGRVGVWIRGPDEELEGVHRIELRYRLADTLDPRSSTADVFVVDLPYLSRIPTRRATVEVRLPSPVLDVECGLSSPIGGSERCLVEELDADTRSVDFGRLDPGSRIDFRVEIQHPTGVVTAP